MRRTPTPAIAFWNSAMCGCVKCDASASGDSHSSKSRKRPRWLRSAAKTYALQPASLRVASWTRVAAATAASWWAGSISISPAMTSMADLLQEEDERDEHEERDQDPDRPSHVAEEARHAHAALLGDRLHHEIRTVADVGVGAHQ